MALLLLPALAGSSFIAKSPSPLIPTRSTRVGAAYADETKGAISGAVLGGLIAGPFGALWGAQIGGGIGANNRANREAQDRLDRMGLSKEVLDAAAACASDIQEAEESYEIVRRAEASQRGLVTELERQAAIAYEAAEKALRGGDEGGARARLEERQLLKPKIAAAKAELNSASLRVKAMEADVLALKERAAQVEAMVGRSASASAELRGSTPMLEPEDPLIQRFRDLEEP